jgi:hypothetical protein
LQADGADIAVLSVARRDRWVCPEHTGGPLRGAVEPPLHIADRLLHEVVSTMHFIRQANPVDPFQARLTVVTVQPTGEKLILD